MSYATARRRSANFEVNKLYQEDRPVHEWYRFVLSFPPHLVREYLGQFGVTTNQTVLDPFCGTGTVPVECKKLGVPSIGIEANPMAQFAAATKVDWQPDPAGLLAHAQRVAECAWQGLAQDGNQGMPTGDNRRAPMLLLREGNGPAHYPLDNTSDSTIAAARRDVRTLPAEQMKLLLTDSISPLPLHKTLMLLDAIQQHQDDRYIHHERLALARTLVHGISNLQFGPEVGVGARKHDAEVIGAWLASVRSIAADLNLVRDRRDIPVVIHHADSRDLLQVLSPRSVDAVFTSPPYPNEKDYTRTTRLESVLLGFIKSKAELQALKGQLVRSNTRGVYKGDDDDRWVAGNTAVERIAGEIERRRIQLGKTSGFERLYARTTKLYFGGMARHLAVLRTILKPGARLGYVVGDQASYLRVMIRTGQLLAGIAESLGYEVLSVDLFRTRLATATREMLREEVVVLQWPGSD